MGFVGASEGPVAFEYVAEVNECLEGEEGILLVLEDGDEGDEEGNGVFLEFDEELVCAFAGVGGGGGAVEAVEALGDGGFVDGGRGLVGLHGKRNLIATNCRF